VNKRRTIWLQKLFAGHFLALFLFIHVVKALHHHDIKQPASKEIASQKHLASNTTCDICEYYFAKDAHPEMDVIQLDPPVQRSPIYTDHHLSQYLTSIGLSCSDRGPPSMV
jgi:hypothetical protein